MATIVEVNDEVHAHGHNFRFVVVSFRGSRSAVGERTGIPDFPDSGDPLLPSKLPVRRVRTPLE
jgi:hypothetical protein